MSAVCEVTAYPSGTTYSRDFILDVYDLCSNAKIVLPVLGDK